MHHNFYKHGVRCLYSLPDESGKEPTSEGQRPRDKRFVITWEINRFVGLLIAIAFLAALRTAHAQDATWLLTPGSGDWNTAANWTPATVPTGTVTFGSSNTTSIGISLNISIGKMLFNAGAPAYSFVWTFHFHDITGTGIVNNSSNQPSFTNNGGLIDFFNTSTAGNATIMNNTVEDLSGETFFFNTSTAGNATITNNVGGGETRFFDSSTASNATITNNFGGLTLFTENASAATATITTNYGGETDFSDTATGAKPGSSPAVFSTFRV